MSDSIQCGFEGNRPVIIPIQMLENKVNIPSGIEDSLKCELEKKNKMIVKELHLLNTTPFF